MHLALYLCDVGFQSFTSSQDHATLIFQWPASLTFSEHPQVIHLKTDSKTSLSVGLGGITLYALIILFIHSSIDRLSNQQDRSTEDHQTPVNHMNLYVDQLDNQNPYMLHNLLLPWAPD